ncbi:MAG: BlaI/MecI/CopY family transcriptional regulator [Defluviitaleaceae bacterium]|nr:BlaI/MecI/CopY family transcriptional regulator [Defluviitaleaceae bacterium]
MALKVHDSELKVMEALWSLGEMTAAQLAKILKEQVGWSRNTTYTVIGKLLEKGAVGRYEPNFVCKPIITREQVQQYEAKELIGKLFDGSAEMFLSAFISGGNISDAELERLKSIVENAKEV